MAVGYVVDLAPVATMERSVVKGVGRSAAVGTHAVA